MLELNSISRTHHDGSVALLRHQEQESEYPRRRNPLACHVLHSEVAFTIREKRSLLATGISWLHYHTESLNPSSLLDIIASHRCRQHSTFNTNTSTRVCLAHLQEIGWQINSPKLQSST
ncbi:hypothetical protein ACQKWADRAFT_300680 [Trichoderma austrokoningii]